MSKKKKRAFIDDLIKAFPEITDDVLDEDWRGLISLQIACFTRYTQNAIDSNNIPLSLKCFQFVEDHLNKVDLAIENSLIISWTCKLNFTNNDKLYVQFPSTLKEIRAEVENHYNSVSSNEKLNAFLKDIRKNEN